jgi:O-antigen ligase
VNLTFLVSPEFALKDGRLVLTLDDGFSTSPLSMGSFASWTVMMGALDRSATGPMMTGVRIASVAMGIAVVILSGSRGQLGAMVISTLVCLPLAAPGRSGVNRLGTFVSLIVIVAAFYFLFSAIVSTLPRFAAERFGAEDVIYSRSSAMSRISGFYSLLSAWAASPVAIVIGLGYLAYGKIPGGSEIDVYVHNSYAEAVFELGIPGLVLIGAGLYFSWRSLIRIQGAAQTPSERSAVAILVAMMLFESIIAAKQGSLWGLPYFIYLGSIAGSIERARTSEIYRLNDEFAA